MYCGNTGNWESEMTVERREYRAGWFMNGLPTIDRIPTRTIRLDIECLKSRQRPDKDILKRIPLP